VLIICFHADQVLNNLIQDETEKSKKKLSYLKIQLFEEMGWTHVSTFEDLDMTIACKVFASLTMLPCFKIQSK
jgi:hypothetical protein